MNGAILVALAIIMTTLLVVAAQDGARRARARFALMAPTATPLVGGAAIAAALPASHGAGGLTGVLVSCAACVSVFTDLQAGYIYDSVVIVSGAAVLVRATTSHTLLDAAIGAAVLSCAFGTVWLASRGRAIGLGDVKFVAVIGASFGWQWGTAAVAAAFVAGGVACAVLLACGVIGRGARVPFAPCLAVGCCIVTLAGGSLS